MPRTQVRLACLVVVVAVNQPVGVRTPAVSQVVVVRMNAVSRVVAVPILVAVIHVPESVVVCLPVCELAWIPASHAVPNQVVDVKQVVAVQRLASQHVVARMPVSRHVVVRKLANLHVVARTIAAILVAILAAKNVVVC